MSKMLKLGKILKDLKSVVVAYSGGLDSTFLLKTAIDALGRENVIAVTALSETYPASEYKEAKRLARKIGARLITIRTDELKDELFNSNPINRCYYCKLELFRRLSLLAQRHKKNVVLDGTNHDDLRDTRYGRKAAAEYDVQSPLLEAGFTKADIRRHSKRLGLSTHDKPAFACLASRIPFGTRISVDDLTRIDKAEEFLKSLGFRQVRARLHGDIARIEVEKIDISKAIESANMIAKGLKKMGFRYVTLDLAGYRTGSMHEVDKKMVAGTGFEPVTHRV